MVGYEKRGGKSNVAVLACTVSGRDQPPKKHPVGIWRHATENMVTLRMRCNSWIELEAGNPDLDRIKRFTVTVRANTSAEDNLRTTIPQDLFAMMLQVALISKKFCRAYHRKKPSQIITTSFGYG